MSWQMTACSRQRPTGWATVTGALVLAALAIFARGAAMARPAGDADLANMDALWGQRDARNVMPDLVALGTESLARAPDGFEIEWRMARAHFWVAYEQNNRVTKKALAGKAADWAGRARAHRPDRVEGHYFYAVSLGVYADCIGAVQAVMEGIAGRFETAAMHAYQIDRDFEHGAPLIVLGRYYYMLPWPKRDLERSRRYLEAAAARHPRALIARVYLAETYYELDEPAKARAELEFTLANEPATGSERDRPRPKPLARAALQRWFPEATVADDAGR